MEQLQGHWVDVNGNTTLDFAGDKMTVTTPYDKNEFKFKITGEVVKYIVIEDPENAVYYGMSDIMISPRGYLSAHQMLLDAEGHEYHFVKEDALEKELEIRIMDRDLPKTIESDEIVSFRLNFSNEDTSYDIPEGSPWHRGRYVFEVVKTEGGYEMSLRGSGSSYIIADYRGAEYVKGLAELIKEQKLAEHNGWSRTNSEHFHGWDVEAEYASGEKIVMDAYGRASLDCPFSIYAFLEYAESEAGVWNR